MPLIETKGAASAQGFGGAGAGASGPVTYIEDVFSTYLYTGNDAALTVTNGIDLATKGGMVWGKSRSASQNHRIYDTARGSNYSLITNGTGAQSNQGANACAFNTDGFSLSAASGIVGSAGFGGPNYVSWTFREQPKFFDIVTYTGNGSTSGRTISHNLGSVPGCIIVKKTSSAEDWYVYHRSLGNTGTLQYFCILNSTAAQDTGGFGMEKASNWTATQFALASGTSALNTNGETYVAYLFAHDAGGFGLSGTDNVISCGSFTSSGSVTTIDLGYEPQWVLLKQTNSTGNWTIADNMRGMPASGSLQALSPNLSNAEQAQNWINTTSTGFTFPAVSGYSMIYIAIRRGPMKVPTSGTSVFSPVTFSTSSGLNQTLGGNFNVDWALLVNAPVSNVHYNSTRLIGASKSLATATANAESSTLTAIPTPTNNNAFSYLSGYFRIEGGNQTYWNGTGSGTNGLHLFARAPGFFDVVCWTGDGTTKAYSHNLGIVPELAIYKDRSNSDSWFVYSSTIGATKKLILNASNASATSSAFADTAPTSTQFTIGSSQNYNTDNFVAYLFASCPGVSKVGSYTGTGALQTVNCGFTGGARFVLIKRTDSTGDWYVWDSARGIVAGSDPYLTLNTTAAEVTTTDWVDTYSAGFELSNAGGNNVNINGATYIFLSVA